MFLDQARDAGEVRAEVALDDLYVVIPGLSHAAAVQALDEDARRRVLDLVLTGLVPPAGPPAG